MARLPETTLMTEALIAHIAPGTVYSEIHNYLHAIVVPPVRLCPLQHNP